MNTLEAIEKRWGCRKFLDKEIEKETLNTVLDAGRYAPSAGNLQDRTFIVVRKKELKSEIAKFAGDQTWMQAAPVIIAIVAENKKNPRYFGKKGEDVHSTQDCSFSAENMLLAATDLGLGVSLVVGFDDGKINELLGINLPSRANIIIVLGYPAEEAKPASKHPLDKFVFFDKHGSRLEDISSPAEAIGKAKEQITEKREEIKKGFIEKIKSLFKRKKAPLEDHFMGETIKISEIEHKEDIPRQLPK